MEKKQITFIFKNIIGGISTMNFGIIKHAQLKKYFDVRVILISADKEFENQVNLFENELNVELFNYSKLDNYSNILFRLKRLIDKKEGIVVTNDGIELDCLKYLGNKQVVVNIVHDLYNLKLALNNTEVIDYFICHTFECSSLLKSNPELKNRVIYLPFGVEIPNIQVRKKTGDTVKIVSLSRLVEGKGVLKLIEIEKELKLINTHVEWLILGDGPSKKELFSQWENKSNVIFKQPHNLELKEILSSADVFISLSEFEGYGISLLESMSYGLVPIITKLPIGIHNLLPPQCGMVVEEIDFRKIAEFISQLTFNESMLLEFKEKSREFVIESYSSKITGQGYLDFFKFDLSKKTNGFKMKQMSNFGVLDSKIIPNIFSRNLKRIKNYVWNKATMSIK